MNKRERMMVKSHQLMVKTHQLDELHSSALTMYNAAWPCMDDGRAKIFFEAREKHQKILAELAGDLVSKLNKWGR